MRGILLGWLPTLLVVIALAALSVVSFVDDDFEFGWLYAGIGAVTLVRGTLWAFVKRQEYTIYCRDMNLALKDFDESRVAARDERTDWRFVPLVRPLRVDR